jgi:hypothetical protein
VAIKRFILSAILLCVVIAAISWLAPRSAEPVYQGKRLTQWLDEYNQAGAMDKTETISRAIRAMGTHVCPRAALD